MSGAVERDRRDRSVLRDTPRRDPCVTREAWKLPGPPRGAVYLTSYRLSLVTPIVLAPDGSGVR